MNRAVFFKWFKRGTLVLAIIPILIFLAFAGAVSLIDFNQYKPQIEQEVKLVTGRDLKIEGAIEVSILPFVFNVGAMSLKNPAGFEKLNLLTIDEVQIELSLPDLLIHKELSILSLELIEPKLHLIKRADGDNWTDIKWFTGTSSVNNPNSAQEALADTEWFERLEKQQVSHREKEVEHASDGFYWVFDSLVIRNGEIQLEDQVQGYTETLTDINILTFDVVLGQPFEVNSDFVYRNSLSEKTNSFHLNGTIQVQNQFKLWVITDWNGVFKLRLPEERKIPEVRLTTSGNRLALDLERKYLVVSNGQLKGLDAHLTSSFSGYFGRELKIVGASDIRNLNFKDWAYYLGIAMPEFLEQKVEGDGNGRFEWQWNGEKLLLTPITLNVSKTEGS